MNREPSGVTGVSKLGGRGEIAKIGQENGEGEEETTWDVLN